ncbi:MAG TPA: L-aspartate oxidase [Bacillales bacterium]|nr:L-aspartate oxidase [Bacillales bacterium]
MTKKHITDVVIIGSGIAALVAAECLSYHKNVIVITKSKKENSNSSRAQGGVAAAIARNDHWSNHFTDTMVAGNFHNDEDAVETLVQRGPELLRALIDRGMCFDKDEKGRIVLGQEGAHSMRRILHAGGDATGKALVNFMLNRLRTNQKVKIIENTLVVDLLVDENRCFGIKVKTNSRRTETIYSRDTILAAGGSGGLYSFTSNDPTVTGDGISLAYRAGANLVDLEFVQFHPTLLYVSGEVKGLISEAVRGEGAVLITKNGSRLMSGVHPQEDLAPRDIVAREINRAVLNGEQIFLDISMIKDFKKRFPTITGLCEENGIDLTVGKIPVVPGAHFHMGGVEVNQQGQTSVEHLYAIGEVACTGVHGANRLASNSLLEGIVFATELAEHLAFERSEDFEIPMNRSEDKACKELHLPEKEEIKAVMMKYVGIVRDEAGLKIARDWLEQYLSIEDNNFDPETLTHEQIGVYNMLQAAWLITTSALMRDESRGGHYRSDFPAEKIDWTKNKIIRNCHVPAHTA